MNKKGNAAVAIILAMVILAIYLVNIAQRECESNKDCSSNSYCGTDYECHEYPNQVIVKQNNYVPAALIVGVALIVAAYLRRGGKIPLLKSN